MFYSFWLTLRGISYLASECIWKNKNWITLSEVLLRFSRRKLKHILDSTLSEIFDLTLRHWDIALVLLQEWVLGSSSQELLNVEDVNVQCTLTLQYTMYNVQCTMYIDWCVTSTRSCLERSSIFLEHFSAIFCLTFKFSDNVSLPSVGKFNKVLFGKTSQRTVPS